MYTKNVINTCVKCKFKWASRGFPSLFSFLLFSKSGHSICHPSSLLIYTLENKKEKVCE